MAQLKDDCFAFDGELTSFKEGLRKIEKHLSVLVGKESIGLSLALNRVLAENLVSSCNVPPHNNSAVDGYAVRYADLNQNASTRLRISGRIAAGDVCNSPIKRGQAVRIFTGAPVPEPLDTIFMQEDCNRNGHYVTLPSGLKCGANYRFAGEDVELGSIVISQGSRLRPQEIGLAASIGKHILQVYKPLRVAIFSTGKEVCDPTEIISEGGIYDTNRFSIAASLQSIGATIIDMGILPDTRSAISEALKVAESENDLIITSGGVSTGEEDHVKAAVETIGKINIWRLAIKPGRPITLGQIKNTPFIGLPGNPVAAMVTFMFIARPIILKLSGRTNQTVPHYKIIADFNHKKKLGRTEWLRVRLSKSEKNHILATKPVSSGAGILTSMVNADGLAELPESSNGVTPGDVLDFFSFEDLLR